MYYINISGFSRLCHYLVSGSNPGATMKIIVLVLSLLALVLFVAADTGEYEYEDDDNAYEDDTSEDQLPEPTPTVSTSGIGKRTIPPSFDPNKSNKKFTGAIRERRNAETNQFFKMLAPEERPANAVINSLSPIVALWAVSAENPNPTTPSD